MRVWRIAFSGVLALGLLLTAVMPVIAAPETQDKVQVQFENKTGSQVRITLTGSATVYLTLNTGKTKTDLATGTYHYSYFACNKTNTGTFKVKPGVTLILAKCGKDSGGGSGNVAQFQNQTGSSVVITLTGPTTVYLTLSTGKTKTELAPGTYKYSYNACGSTNTGTFKVKPGATLTLPKCKKGGGGGSADEKNQAITNNTGGTITMILSGPQNYTFYVATGKSQISLIKGNYNYTIYGCGGAVLTGSRKLPGGGNWVFWCY